MTQEKTALGGTIENRHYGLAAHTKFPDSEEDDTAGDADMAAALMLKEKQRANEEQIANDALMAAALEGDATKKRDHDCMTISSSPSHHSDDAVVVPATPTKN